MLEPIPHRKTPSFLTRSDSFRAMMQPDSSPASSPNFDQQKEIGSLGVMALQALSFAGHYGE
jgi:hypothetical protein